MSVALLFLIRTHYRIMRPVHYSWNTIPHIPTPSLYLRMVQNPNMESDIVLSSLHSVVAVAHRCCLRFYSRIVSHYFSFQNYFYSFHLIFYNFFAILAVYFPLFNILALHPLVLSILEWLYILQHQSYHVTFCTC